MILNKITRRALWFLLTLGAIAAFMLMPSAVANAQGVAAPLGPLSSADGSYLLSFGYPGALVFAAIVCARAVEKLAGGVRVTFAVELSEKDRAIASRIADRIGTAPLRLLPPVQANQ